MVSVEELVAAVSSLRVDQSLGQPARHQPITLLWAIGRAAGGLPRLVAWKDARDELRKLLQTYGRDTSDPSPEYPFVALSRSGPWVLDGVEGEIPQARGSKLKKWLGSQNPRGGLTQDFYDRMTTDAVARQAVVDYLLERFFDADQSRITDDLLLSGPIFNGFGAVPGVAVGQAFINRAALTGAKVHRPNQSGICGSPATGAESIVVSGGYEDDQDFGDEIIYTGEGGRTEGVKQQTHDQKLTLRNAALVTSLTTGAPVRVIRGAGGDPQHSPKADYRYDGLYRVVEYWSERGQAGHLVWRFRLVQIPTLELGTPQPPSGRSVPRQPAGQSIPTRVTTTTQRIVRSTAVADFVKRLHDYTCQVCGIRLPTPTGAYAEAAHIRGLGSPHNGPDVASNVLCLCPNHHTLFDFGMLSISDDLTVEDRSNGELIGSLREHEAHEIDRRYLSYHREHRAKPVSDLLPSAPEGPDFGSVSVSFVPGQASSPESG